MVTSDFTPEVEMWPFRACAMKNMHYNRYYINSLVIVDLAVGQIPRSAERISSFVSNFKINKPLLNYSIFFCNVIR